MNSNDKVGLIERVNHASEDQAKRALNSMILKCNVQQDTIARAIKDAIERHLPTPMIVYQQPESEDDDEAALDSSRKRSNKKQVDQDDSSQDEDDSPSAASKKRQSTRRGDIDADPHIGNLILEKKKTKIKGKKKRSSDHDQEHNSRDASKMSKSKYASEPRAETKQRTCADSKATASEQKGPPVIDLVTSSDDETSDTEPSRNEILDDKTSDDNSSDNESPDDYSSDSDSSDDGDSEQEAQGDALVVGVGPSQEGSNKNANQANERSDGSRTAARSVTISMAKASNQNDSNKIRPFVPNKKRKVPEPTVGEIHDERRAKSATDGHANKRSKQNHPQDLQRSPEDRTCRKCGLLFPSVAQLLKHRLYCKNSTAPFGNHHRSEPPSDNRSRLLEQAQKASGPAGNSFTDEPHNTVQLPLRPIQRTTADRGLSVPPPSFVHEPNNFPRGPTPTPLALARGASDVNPLPPGLVHSTMSLRSSDRPPHRQSRRSKQWSSRQRLLQEVRGVAVHQCKDCKNEFQEPENSEHACHCHPGMARMTLLLV